MNTLTLSPKGLALLKTAEGLSLKPYKDAGGFSIGYGHFIKPEESGVGGLMAGVITPAKAEALLYHDVEWAVKAVNRYVTLALRQNQFDALVSIVFNIGETAFRKSTLVRLLNEGKLIAAAAQFDRWKYSEGKVSKVLVARRAAEKTLFQTA
jgi:lysozyme